MCSSSRARSSAGIGDVELRLVELRPPYRTDPEIQLWPPLPYELHAIDRLPPLSDEEYARRDAERRAWRVESEKLSQALQRLHSTLARSYAEYEDAQSASAIEVVSELVGDARYPMPDHRGAKRVM